MQHMGMTTEGFAGESGLTFVRDIVKIELDDRQLRRERDAGTRRRVRRGAYIDEARWSKLKPLERYRVQILAVVGTRHRTPVVAYDSAAAIWGYPRAGRWPGMVHVIVDPTSGVRSGAGIAVHRDQLEPQDVVEVDGMLVTTPQRTLVDLARTADREVSVSAIDRALNERRSPQRTRVSKEQLLAVHERIATQRGAARARNVITFANGLADNPGESLSRIRIFELGFPTPMLQCRHINPRGGYYFTDFEWPDYKTIGEFDGLGKYLKEEYLRSLTPGQAVVEEKIREDHLRAENNAFARWEPDDVFHPAQLRRILLQAGLPIVR